MNKAELKKYLKDLKVKQKEGKAQFKSVRPSFKKRMNGHLVFLAIRFNNARKKVGNKIHSKRNDIKELKIKLDYIVDSLKATVNTTDEIRAKTIEDIVDNIDDL